jgi:hypothetical protein
MADASRIITLVCTDRGRHEPQRVGFLFPGREPILVMAHTGPAARRHLGETGWHGVQPEKCPTCKHAPRRRRETWQQIAELALAAGKSSLDVSYLP